jgi:transketolase
VALASPDKHVYCLLSDGECAEGAVWEALRFAADKPLYNLTVVVNANGWSALSSVDIDKLEKRLKAFLPTIVLIRSPSSFPGVAENLAAHYEPLTEEGYKIAKQHWGAL